MQALLKNWLGPEIETNLRYAVEYKHRRINATAFTGSGNSFRLESRSEIRDAVCNNLDQKRYRCTYDDNGSTLRAAVEFREPDNCTVQLSELTKTTHPFTCLVSDGHTLVKAKFSSRAIKTIPDKFRNIASLGSHILINISKFEIQASVLGIDPLVILIEKVDIIDASYTRVLGTPTPLEGRREVKSWLKKLAALEQGDEQSAAGPEMGSMDEPSQQFATQVRKRSPSDCELLQGVNLEGPVAPRRNDGRVTWGSKPDPDNSRAQHNGQPLKTHAPLDILKLNPLYGQTKPRQPSREIGVAVSDLRTFRTGEHDAPRSSDQADHFDSPARSLSLTVSEADATSPLARSDVEMGDKHAIESPQVQQGRPQESASAEIPLERQSPPIEKSGNDREEADAPDDIATQFEPGKSSSKDGNFWTDAPPLVRSITIVPKEQAELLGRNESWNPPNGSLPFPSPNVPHTLLEKLQGSKMSNMFPSKTAIPMINTKMAVAVTHHGTKVGHAPTASSNSSDHSIASPTESEGPPLSGNHGDEADVTEDDAEENLPWSSSPPYISKSPSLSRNEFPPDSSAVDGPVSYSPIKNQSLFADDEEQSTPAGIAQDLAMKDVVDLEHEGQVLPNGSRTSQIFSSAVCLAKTGRQNPVAKDVQSTADSSTLNSSLITGYSHKASASKPFRLPDSSPNATQSAHTKSPRQTSSPASGFHSQSARDSFNIHLSHIGSTEESPYRLKNPNATPHPALSLSQSQSRANLPSGSALLRPSPTKLVPSTFPVSQFPAPQMRVMADLDENSSNVSSEITAGLAKQQIHDGNDASFQESVQSSTRSEQARPSTPPRETDRPQASSTMITSSPPIEGSVRPRVLGKRAAFDPATPKRPEKRAAKAASAFQFSQDDPVLQDPAIEARMLKREFLRTGSLGGSTSVELDRPKFELSNMPPISPKNHKTKSSRIFGASVIPKVDAPTLENCMPYERTGRCPFPVTCLYTHVRKAVKKAQSIAPESASPSSVNKPSKSTSVHSDVQAHNVEASTNRTSPASVPPNTLRVPSEPSGPLNDRGGSTLPEKPFTVEILYTEFTAAYPTYSGNAKHFTSMLGKISTLEKNGRLHRSLWDDFVTKHKTAYAPYMLECADQGDTPMLYEKFYDEQIEQPTDMKGIINRAKLRKLFPTDKTDSRRPPVDQSTSSRTQHRQLNRKFQESPRGRDSYRPDYHRPDDRNDRPSDRHVRFRPRSPTNQDRSDAPRPSRKWGSGAKAQGNEWWKDDNTPMKEFTRSYNATKTVAAELTGADTSNRINVLEWEL